MENTSKGDRYENLSPKKYLNMIKPYLRDLINDHKATAEWNNGEDNRDTERGERKVQLVMQNSCISTRDFEETGTICSASKPVEIFMGTDTDGAIDKLFDKLLQRFQQISNGNMET